MQILDSQSKSGKKTWVFKEKVLRFFRF